MTFLRFCAIHAIQPEQLLEQNGDSPRNAWTAGELPQAFMYSGGRSSY